MARILIETLLIGILAQNLRFTSESNYCAPFITSSISLRKVEEETNKVDRKKPIKALNVNVIDDGENETLVWCCDRQKRDRTFNPISSDTKPNAMAASPVHSSHLTLVVVLHLVFSIVAIAFLSYKVYFPDNELSTKVFHLEKELFSIREEISLAGTSYGVTTVPSPTSKSTAAKFYRNERYRRTVRRDPKSGSKDEIRRAECVKNLLNNLQVCTNSPLMDSIQVPTSVAPEKCLLT